MYIVANMSSTFKLLKNYHFPLLFNVQFAPPHSIKIEQF